MDAIDLPLSDLTLAQKLQLMEALWDDLGKHEQILESPQWHESVLQDREDALAAGKASVSGWEEAKKRIRKNVSCE
jgi:putative addiction module component (TIGR02574 family)